MLAKMPITKFRIIIKNKHMLQKLSIKTTTYNIKNNIKIKIIKIKFYFMQQK